MKIASRVCIAELNRARCTVSVIRGTNCSTPILYNESKYRGDTRGHPYKLCKSRCMYAVRRNFFVERVVDVWNYLPPKKLTVNFASLPTFKSSLKSVDFSSYLKRTV